MPGMLRPRATIDRRSKPRRPQLKSPQARVKEQSADEAQHRIAEIAIEERHRPGRDAAGKAITHDQRHTATQLRNETVEIAEIVTVIGIAHDDIAATRGGDAGLKGRAIAAPFGGDHPRPGRLRQALRTVGAAVIRHQDFAGDSRPRQITLCLSHAAADGGRLVETGHQDGEFDLTAAHARSRCDVRLISNR